MYLLFEAQVHSLVMSEESPPQFLHSRIALPQNEWHSTVLPGSWGLAIASAKASGIANPSTLGVSIRVAPIIDVFENIMKY
jgi:hypothetical protein